MAGRRTTPRGRRPVSAGATSALDACSAGTRPNRTAVTNGQARGEEQDRPSSPISSTRGAPAAPPRRARRRPSRPRGAPGRRRSTASSRLSVSSCRDEPPAAGAERAAHRHLARACAGAREQQVGDVDAGDQQHEADRAQQHEQPVLYVADHLRVERADGNPAPVFDSGCAAASCAASNDADVCACSSVPPGFSRAITLSTTRPRAGVVRFRRRGRHTGPRRSRAGRNAAGMTPMT